MFFFSSRRRHTRWPRDWSSDCALPIFARVQTAEAYFYLGELALLRVDVAEARRRFDAVVDLVGKDVALKRLKIGRASCRERGRATAVSGRRMERGAVGRAAGVGDVAVA